VSSLEDKVVMLERVIKELNLQTKGQHKYKLVTSTHHPLNFSWNDNDDDGEP
jgi:hypothetical protein